MSRFIFAAAFTAGAIAIVWIGRLFLGAELLGLLVTVLIGALYLLGSFELVHYRRATQSLLARLRSTEAEVDDLDSWLQGLDPTLHSSVRTRIEGSATPLPAPVITPYLVGLLVMLGLLGTFIGMVATLKGAVVALEGSNELEAIRQGLAAPIEGLGLAFGTSVAGVAASAMLGLLSTISRRERINASQLLEQTAHRFLSTFSANQQQRLAFQAIQQQALALPAVVEQLSGLSHNLASLGDKLGQNLLENQDKFQSGLNDQFAGLLDSVDNGLKTTLVESANQINNSIQPLAKSTLEQVVSSVESLNQKIVEQGRVQQAAISTASQAGADQVVKVTEAMSASQRDSLQDVMGELTASVEKIADKLDQKAGATFDSMEAVGESWAAQQQVNAKSLAESMRTEFEQLREQEAGRAEASVAQLSNLQAAVAEHLASLGSALEEPMTRLIETASEAPKAAAEVIAKLRAEISNNLDRDNELLAERARLLEQFDAMSKELQSSSQGQREAVEGMIERSSETLSQLTNQFGKQVQSETGKMTDVAEHFAASSAEMATLGEVFMAAVSSFEASNQSLMSSLANIESALEKSSSRSDEQLAYYVAQAREIIDHNLLSHQQIIAALNAQKPEQLAVEEVG